ncbi:hypothetical protein AX16_004272 [Volvariella volvacea WC 439]|nr:hypothetical protein AX16_004272 [Volvariella volvacea WC 439]
MHQSPPQYPQICDAPWQWAAFFSQANINNREGTIIATAGTTNVHHHTSPIADARALSARERLRALVARDAVHTGRVRADPLECDRNTRQAIIEDIVIWIEDERRTHHILWLRGPAGIGKSAIAKRVADRLDEPGSKAKVAGSFFFFSGDAQRNSLDHFVPTIAYRLAVSIEEVGRMIDGVIERDPEVLYADAVVQWKKLVIETVMAVSRIPPAVFIIDGLDECGNEKDQRRLLELITACGDHFPIAFLIASRPEPHIVNCFNADPLSSFCRSTIDLTHCGDSQEIELFIRSSFSRIYTRHRDILRSYSVNGAWPSEETIYHITYHADGQYIYPVTLFKYIDQDYENPHERLQECIHQLPETLSCLDALYTQIMQSSHHPDNYQVQNLLFLILTPTLLEPIHPRRSLPPRVCTIGRLATIVGLDPVQCRLKLRRLHSLIDVPSHDDHDIHIHHLSFIDFIFDAARSGQYHLNPSHCASRIVETCLSSLEKRKGTEIAPIVRCWWRACKLISHSGVSSGLVSRMEKVDLAQVLWGVQAFADTWHPLERDYGAFLDSCGTWVVYGSEAEAEIEAEEREMASTRKNSTLLERFPSSAFDLARIAHYIEQVCTSVEQSSSVRRTGKEAPRCPVSWKGLLALAEPLWERMAWCARRDWVDDSDVVWATLKVFTSDTLFQKLPEGDQEYLRTWSRPWSACPGSAPFWRRELVDAFAGRPPSLSLNAIVRDLRELPAEYHFHELNRDAVLCWLEEECEYEDVKDVVEHWEVGECYLQPRGCHKVQPTSSVARFSSPSSVVLEFLGANRGEKRLR